VTERHAGYIVSLDESVRDEDAEQIITALRQIRGVVSVRPVVEDVQAHIGQERARAELSSRITAALHEILWERR
jgi:hypothetical protein